MPGTSNALSLYRQMLRKGKTLKFTDKSYYLRRIRDEFEKNRNLTSAEDISHAIKKAEAFLEKDRVV